MSTSSALELLRSSERIGLLPPVGRSATRDGDQTIPERVQLLVRHRAEQLSTLDRPTRHLGALDHQIIIYEETLRSQIPSHAEDLKETEPA